MIACSSGVIAIIAAWGLSPRQHKVLRCSTAPIGLPLKPLRSVKQYLQCQPLNRARGKPDVMARCHSFGLSIIVRPREGTHKPAGIIRSNFLK